MKTEIQVKIETLAYKRSIPFCYHDYIECPEGRCPKCGSDDLMRLVRGVGCEYGTDWIIEHILATEPEPANLETAFEESVRDCYPKTTKVGWMEFDTVTLMKEQDPFSWRCALSEYESQEESEGNIVSFDNGSSYYNTQDVERILESASPHCERLLSPLASFRSIVISYRDATEPTDFATARRLHIFPRPCSLHGA